MSHALPPTDPGLCPPPTDPRSARWIASWTHLEQAYRPALLRYGYHILARGGAGPRAWDEAEDVVQDFFLHAMATGSLAARGRTIASFRGWILEHLYCFTIDRMRRNAAGKRRPRGGFEPPEALGRVADPSPPPEACLEFDKGALQVALKAALARVASETKDVRTGALRAAILQDLIATDGKDRPELAAALGLTLRELNRRRHTARRRLAVLLREELGALVTSPEELAEMLRNLAPYLPPGTRESP